MQIGMSMPMAKDHLFARQFIELFTFKTTSELNYIFVYYYYKKKIGS